MQDQPFDRAVTAKERYRHTDAGQRTRQPLTRGPSPYGGVAKVHIKIRDANGAGLVATSVIGPSKEDAKGRVGVRLPRRKRVQSGDSPGVPPALSADRIHGHQQWSSQRCLHPGHGGREDGVLDDRFRNSMPIVDGACAARSRREKEVDVLLSSTTTNEEIDRNLLFTNGLRSRVRSQTLACADKCPRNIQLKLWAQQLSCYFGIDYLGVVW